MSALATAPTTGVSARRDNPPARRVLPAVITALVAIVGAAVIYGVAVWTSAGQIVDQYILDAVRRSSATAHVPHTLTIDSVTNPRLWIVAALLATVGSLVPAILGRTRLSAALARTAALLVFPIAVVVLARLLRDGVLERPRLHSWIAETSNSAPSGHAAASSACVVVLVAASPKWLRPVVTAAGGVWAAVIAFGLIADGWHRPSDIMISVLLVIGFGMLLPDPYTDDPAPHRARLCGFAAFAVTVIATPLLVSLWYPEPRQVATAAGIAAVLGAALAIFRPCVYRTRYVR